MFDLYNTALRAYGNADKPGYVPMRGRIDPGESVANRFVTTIHAINSGVLKLSKLQPACTIYRGVSRMKLPDGFLKMNEFGVRGGVPSPDNESFIYLHVFLIRGLYDDTFVGRIGGVGLHVNDNGRGRGDVICRCDRQRRQQPN